MDILIFVTLGTQDKPFTRLLKAIEDEIIKGNIDEEVIVQAGYTKYFSDKMKIFDLISQEDFVSYMNRADLIITHGGVGSIITALKMNKKIIAVPRLAKYGEHINDHQLQIVKCFEKKKFLIPLYDTNDFEKLLKVIKDFKPAFFESNNENFVNFLDKIIKL